MEPFRVAVKIQVNKALGRLAEGLSEGSLVVQVGDLRIRTSFAQILLQGFKLTFNDHDELVSLGMPDEFLSKALEAFQVPAVVE